MTSPQTSEPVVLDEAATAKAFGLTVSWLSRDRRTKRILPFYRLGGRTVRYDVERVREALAAVEEGGQRKPKARGAK